jgi:hypothetical protein
MKCIICKGEIEQKEHWAEGNNAEPIAKGRCCDACNMTVVIPTRLHFINNPL